MIERFTIGVSRTINLGNVESLRIEASITVGLDFSEDNTPEENVVKWKVAKQDAQVELRKLLEETYRNQHKEKK